MSFLTMHKIALLAILLMLSNVTYSAEPTDSAWSIVSPQECRFSGEFTQQKVLTGLANALVSTGVFFYDCELGIIWKTLSPNVAALVLNKQGDSYLVKRLKIEAIQSQQNKFISQLIMALVSADETYLAKTFNSSRVDHNTVILTPSNRRLKQAIKSITLSQNAAADITFDMLDQNLQTTSIVAKVLVNYPADSQPETTPYCLEISALSKMECGLLKTSTD